jgi:Sec-independent protein secretion pathway component TatC
MAAMIILLVVLVLIGVVLANVFSWRGSTIAGISVTTTTVVLAIAGVVVAYYVVLPALRATPYFGKL